MENLEIVRRLAIGAGAALIVGLVAAPVAAAQAAPEYVSSEPEDGATVHKAPKRVEVTFNEPLDESSTLYVTDECDREVSGDTTEVEGSSMSIEIIKTPSGDYHVAYLARSIEGLTGETEGHFMFTVHAGTACDGESDHDHNGNDDDNGKHDKHDDDRPGGRGDHTDHGMDDHDDGTDHTDHAAGGDDHEDHAAGGGGGHDKHGNGKPDKHANHEPEKDVAAPGEVPGITSDTARRLLDRADSTALITSLVLCALLGILGGAVLRFSARH